jgi:hypothetical protein
MSVRGVPAVRCWHRKVSNIGLDEESLKIQAVPHGEQSFLLQFQIDWNWMERKQSKSSFLSNATNFGPIRGHGSSQGMETNVIWYSVHVGRAETRGVSFDLFYAVYLHVDCYMKL